MTRKRYLDGLEDVNRVFARVPGEMREKLTHAMNQGTREVADRARVLVPRDQGDLAETIDARPVRARADGTGLVARVVAGTTAQEALAAFRQEFGRAAGPGDHPGHAAQPFFFPAYLSVRKRVRSRVKRAIAAAARALARG